MKEFVPTSIEKISKIIAQKTIAGLSIIDDAGDFGDRAIVFDFTDGLRLTLTFEKMYEWGISINPDYIAALDAKISHALRHESIYRDRP